MAVWLRHWAGEWRGGQTGKHCMTAAAAQQNVQALHCKYLHFDCRFSTAQAGYYTPIKKIDNAQKPCSYRQSTG